MLPNRGVKADPLWSTVLESHQPVRFCKPPPALLGQRDKKVKFQRPMKDQNEIKALAEAYPSARVVCFSASLKRSRGGSGSPLG